MSDGTPRFPRIIDDPPPPPCSECGRRGEHKLQCRTGRRVAATFEADPWGQAILASRLRNRKPDDGD